MPYALFRGAKQISKLHTDKQCAWVEAFERKVVLIGRRTLMLPKPYEIREVKEQE
jgi:hypothetical protein